MCDFHSIVVRIDGAKAHVPKNSHSDAVQAAKWTENDRMADMRGARFVECEWNGEGAFPGVDKITRGQVNEKQRKVIEGHYTALALLLVYPSAHAERMCFDGGIFSGDEYADVRWKVILHENCPQKIADRLAETSLHTSGETIKSFHSKIKAIGGGFSIKAGCKITAPVLAEVGGSVYVRENATFTAPVLAEVGGYVDVGENATFTAPKLGYPKTKKS